MCLNIITKRYATPTTEERRAYKIIKYVPNWDTKTATPYMGAPLEVGVWMTAYERPLRTEGRTLYPGIPEGSFTQNVSTDTLGKKEVYTSGWHTFATRREARAFLKMTNAFYIKLEKHRIVAVKVRGITVEGYDGCSYDHNFISAKIRTLVSKEMFIESFKRVR